jgi:hypothetical protein
MSDWKHRGPLRWRQIGGGEHECVQFELIDPAFELTLDVVVRLFYIPGSLTAQQADHICDAWVSAVEMGRRDRSQQIRKLLEAR